MVFFLIFGGVVNMMLKLKCWFRLHTTRDRFPCFKFSNSNFCVHKLEILSLELFLEFT